MWCLFFQSSILTHNTIIPPHGMTKNHMRLLTEQELHDIYGGNIFMPSKLSQKWLDSS